MTSSSDRPVPPGSPAPEGAGPDPVTGRDDSAGSPGQSPVPDPPRGGATAVPWAASPVETPVEPPVGSTVGSSREPGSPEDTDPLAEVPPEAAPAPPATVPDAPIVPPPAPTDGPAAAPGETAAAGETAAPGETAADPSPSSAEARVATPPTGEAAPPPPTGAHPTTGAFAPYTIGDPGRAFGRTRPRPATDRGVTHDVVVDAAVVSDPAGTERLVLRGASGRGLAHQQYGDPRQDDIAYTLSPDGSHLVCAVADGVSSGAWSHVAARIAVEEGVEQVGRLVVTCDPAELDWRGLFAGLTTEIADAAATLPGGAALSVDATPRDVAALMATTIVIGVIGIVPDEAGTHRVTIVRIGDASAWLLDDEDGWVALGEVKNEGTVIADSATACLPLLPQEDPVVVETSLGAGSALLLLTDGVGDPLGSGRGEVGATLRELWARPPHPLEFAAQACFGRKTYDDDRGAIGVWPVEP